MEEKQKVTNTPANFLPRILWGAVILIVLVGFLGLRILSEYVFDVLIACLMVMCAIEVENLLHKMDRPTHYVAVALYPILIFICTIISAESGLNYAYLILLNVAILVVMALLLFALPLIFSKWGMRAKARDNFDGSLAYYAFQKTMNTVFVCLWPTFLMSFMFILNHFNSLDISGVAETYANSGADIGLMALVLMFATSMFADTFAMLTGRFVGGPKISLTKLGPGKSYAGLIGGIIGACIASVIVFAIFNAFDIYSNLFNSFNYTIWTFLLGGLFCGIFTMGGDLFSSFFKRKAVVKDYSNLIPGHGGIMDRCNGLLVNAVLVFTFFIILFD